MILTIDCGNSNICIAVHENNVVSPLFFERIHTDRQFTREVLAKDLRMILRLHGLAPSDIEGGILSSVVPMLTDVLREAAEEVTGRKILVVDCRLRLAFENLMALPETVGQDIMSDVSGALVIGKAPLITIDMGTATV
ncbi:MAG: type III pantothenate kinase, partial [Lachnospiraceae bacterium]|nr:type III pantothenate kinase [Lachnospiraceae bacterium]